MLKSRAQRPIKSIMQQYTTYAPQIGGPNFAQFIVNTVDNGATEEVLDRYADRYSS